MARDDWIKMTHALGTSPEVVQMATILETDRLRVIGGLYALWCISDLHADPDGELQGYTVDAIDALVGWHGFAEAAITAEWLEKGDGSLRIPNFQYHNGVSAKRRAEDTRRKQAERASDFCPENVRSLSKHIPKKVREATFDADGWRCVYCGWHMPTGRVRLPAGALINKAVLSIDHLIPLSAGGTNEAQNLVTACLSCNMTKDGRTPDQAGMIPAYGPRFVRKKADNSRTNVGQISDQRREEKSLNTKPPLTPPCTKGGKRRTRKERETEKLERLQSEYDDYQKRKAKR